MTKKIILVVVALIVVLGGVYIGISMSGKTSDTTTIDENGVPTTKTTAVAGSCQSQFDSLYAQNKVDLSTCNTDIRTGSYTGGTAPVQKRNNVVLVFDASGSMVAKIGNETRMEIAKKAVGDFFAGLEGSDTQISLVVYGHKGDNTETNKPASCAGIDELYKFGSANSEKIKETLAQFKPTGWTPIENGLKKAYEILAPYTGPENNNSIFLISDGIESCGGNPAGFVTKKIAEGVNVAVNVVGLGTPTVEAEQLKDIAEAANGKYYDAQSRESLVAALNKQKEQLAEFDHRISRLSEKLSDINSATKNHFNCLANLEIERAHMMLDIYADKKVPDSCAKEVDTLYTKGYTQNRSSLDASFEKIMADWEAAKKK